MGAALTTASQHRSARHMAARTGRVLALCGFALLLSSFFWTETAPAVLKLVVAAAGVLAFFRVRDALLVVAAITPVSRLLTVNFWADAPPGRFVEALALAVLVGWLLGTWKRHDTAGADRLLSSSFARPVLLFVVTVLASAFVVGASVQAWKDYPWPFVQDVLAFVVRDYLFVDPDPRPWADWPSGLRFIGTSALLLEGLALFLCAAQLCRRDPAYTGRLAAMLVVGGLGAAVLSLTDFASDVIRGATLETIRQTLTNAGWARHVRKVNVAGSFFVLTGLMAVGLSLSTDRRRAGWGLAALTIVAALLLTGSRSAILAVAVVLIFLGAYALQPRMRRLDRPKRLAVLNLAAAGVVVAVVLGARLVAAGPALESLRIRSRFTDTSLHIWATEPVFGVGMGEYYARYPSFSPPELLAKYPRENAHNYFLQIGAELGLVGLVLFLWLLAVPLVKASRTLVRGPTDLCMAAITGSVAGFLLTCVTGHPLLLAEVAFPFWLSLGMVRGWSEVRATSGRGEAAAPAPRSAPVATANLRFLTLVVVAVVAASIPGRIGRAVEEVDFTRVSYGLHNWETEASGVRYRWTSRRATTFLPNDARRVTFALQALPTDRHRTFQVEILVDGRLAETLHLADGGWHHVDLSLPAREDGLARRIDLRVSPAWRPDEVLPDSSDTRELGVKMSEIDVQRSTMAG